MTLEDLDTYSFAQRAAKKTCASICMDLGSSNRAPSRGDDTSPWVVIVADRFHVIRLIQQHFMDLIRQLAPNAKHHRGYLAAPAHPS